MINIKLCYGLAALIVSQPLSAQTADTAPTIKPGAIWRDDRGEHINAHGRGRLWLPEPRAWTLDVRSGVTAIQP